MVIRCVAVASCRSDQHLVSTRNNFRTSVAIRYFTQQGEGTLVNTAVVASRTASSGELSICSISGLFRDIADSSQRCRSSKRRVDIIINGNKMRSCGQVAAVISNLVSTRNNFRTSVAIRYFTQQGEGTIVNTAVVASRTASSGELSICSISGLFRDIADSSQRCRSSKRRVDIIINGNKMRSCGQLPQ